MQGRTLLRCLLIGALLVFGSSCSLSTDSDYSKISIRMVGGSPVAKLFAPFTQGLTAPTTTSGFTCLGVNVMGIGIPPRIHECGCTGTNCTCGQDELLAYSNLPQNIAGHTFCGYAGVTSPPVTNDAAPKTIKLSVPSGPKRIIEMVGVVDTGNVVCSQNLPIGQAQESQTNKPEYYDVGRVVVDLFNSQTVSINDTFTDLSAQPAEQAKRKIGCGNDSVPSSYIAFIPTEANLVAYWPMIESTGITQAIAVGSANFSSMSDANGGIAGGTGPLLQSLDSSANFALSLPGGTSRASGTVTAAFTFTGAVTIEAWVKLPAVSGLCTPFGKIFEMGAGTPQIKLHCLPGDTAGFQLFDGTGSVFVGSTVALTDGAWHHLVGVYKPASGAALFVDGVDTSTSQSGSSVAPLTFGATNIFGVSGSTNGLPAGSFVSHVALYTTNFSATTVLQHFHAAGR